MRSPDAITISAIIAWPSCKDRARCIEHHGAICQMCGFDFKSTYGDIGTDRICVGRIDASISEHMKKLLPYRAPCATCHAIYDLSV
jgi:predicted HNH restriction endonuclease